MEGRAVWWSRRTLGSILPEVCLTLPLQPQVLIVFPLVKLSRVSPSPTARPKLELLCCYGTFFTLCAWTVKNYYPCS